MVKTEGVLHFTIPVKDLDRSEKFYTEILGMEKIRRNDHMVFMRAGQDCFVLTYSEKPIDPNPEGAHDILYWVDKNNPRGGRPENPQRDSQFPYWEYPVQAWFSGSPLSAGAPLQLPGGSFIITAPQDGAVVSGENAIAISVFHPNPASVNRISYYLNDAPIGESAAAPFSLSFSSPVRGSATLRAVAESSSGSETRVISFTIQ